MIVNVGTAVGILYGACVHDTNDPYVDLNVTEMDLKQIEQFEIKEGFTQPK